MKIRRTSIRRSRSSGRSVNKPGVQYTIRAVPVELDRTLRERARVQGISLNTLLLDVLSAAIDPTSIKRKPNNLEKYFGSVPPEPELDRILDGMRKIDEEKWR